MQQPIQITIKDKDIDHSQELVQHIEDKANKLQQFFENIIACKVVLDQTQKHKQQGKLYNVRINVTVPGEELVVNHDEDENIFIAIRDSFDHMRRQLEDYAQRLKGDVKPHAEIIHGKIVRLFEDFGFIEDQLGDEYYFNENNLVHPQFSKLQIGNTVRFIQAMGDEGPQAHRVSAEI